jgi:hypothetical protein
MVPIPVGTWHTEMIDKLYSSLFGKECKLARDEGDQEASVDVSLEAEDGLVLVA